MGFPNNVPVSDVMRALGRKHYTPFKTPLEGFKTMRGWRPTVVKFQLYYRGFVIGWKEQEHRHEHPEMYDKAKCPYCREPLPNNVFETGGEGRTYGKPIAK